MPRSSRVTVVAAAGFAFVPELEHDLSGLDALLMISAAVSAPFFTREPMNSCDPDSGVMTPSRIGSFV